MTQPADPANILLVNDRREALLALEETLKPLRQNVITARSGGEALKRLLNHDVAVILLDVDLPDMDGFQTAKLIRERERTRRTPLIFLSVSRGDAHAKQAYALGGVDYLIEPLSPEIVRSKVSVFVQMFEQRRELERQSALLKAEHDFASAILDIVGGFVLVLDAAGRIVRVNRAFQESTGLTFDRVRGNFLYEYLEDRESAKEFFKQARGHKECRDYWLVSGNSRWLVSWCCTALGSELAGSGRLVVTGRDITELRQRTEELEGFTYSVSHDMRAPVRAIDGFTRILIEEYASSLDDEGRRLLDIVRQNTEKMGQLIDGLLALSRLGREKLIFTEIDMAELARTAFEEQKTAGGAQRDIVFRLQDMPPAHGDRRLIMQVFQNLLSNAIKFTRRQPTAFIEAGSSAGARENIYFVRDNGVGFDLKHAQKLFGTFQRLHAATEFEGSGIGLATVQRIIDRHGGRVWAEAAPDSGAAFYFSLPTRGQRR